MPSFIPAKKVIRSNKTEDTFQFDKSSAEEDEGQTSHQVSRSDINTETPKEGQRVLRKTNDLTKVKGTSRNATTSHDTPISTPSASDRRQRIEKAKRKLFKSLLQPGYNHADMSDSNQSNEEGNDSDKSVVDFRINVPVREDSGPQSPTSGRQGNNLLDYLGDPDDPPQTSHGSYAQKRGAVGDKLDVPRKLRLFLLGR